MIDLENNEKILLQARRHGFFLFTRLIALFPLVAIPIIFVIGMQRFGGSDPEASPLAGIFYHADGSGTAFVIFLLFSWLLSVWIGAFVVWTDYYLDVLAVTDHRLINIEQKGLFSRETSSLHLDKIQDVSVEINGLLATFLSFGSLRVQTAGEVEEFVLHGIKDPNAIKKLILEQHERAMTKLRTVRIEKDDGS
jgi:uncharacterized membrane protein YdbT with pleckstrin-like domain